MLLAGTGSAPSGLRVSTTHQVLVRLRFATRDLLYEVDMLLTYAGLVGFVIHQLLDLWAPGMPFIICYQKLGCFGLGKTSWGFGIESHRHLWGLRLGQIGAVGTP